MEYSKDLHTRMILDGMKQGGGYLVHEGVFYHLGKVFLSQSSKLKQEILQIAHKEFLSNYMQSVNIYTLIMRSFDWEGMKEELHQHYDWEELHQHLQECNSYEEMGQPRHPMQKTFQPSLSSLKRGEKPMPNSMCMGDLNGKESDLMEHVYFFDLTHSLTICMQAMAPTRSDITFRSYGIDEANKNSKAGHSLEVKREIIYHDGCFPKAPNEGFTFSHVKVTL